MLDSIKTFVRPQNKTSNGLFITMLICGVIGFVAAFVLSVEKLAIIKDPDAVLSCSVNVVLNCASVMKTPQAELFGFPNSYIGVAGFAVVIAVAAGALMGATYTRSYLLTAQIFYGFGLVFAYWLFFQSVFVIQVLCPWCLVVTVVTTLIFETLLRYNLRENIFRLSKRANAGVQVFLNKDYDRLVVGVWLVAMIAIVFMKFGEGLFL